jgi:predicted HTH domain antitoxin
MYNITLSIPDEALEALQISPQNISSEMLLAAAVKLYECGRLSAGAAANLAGIPKVVFLSKLANYEVDTFKQCETELAEDFANA